MSITIDQTYFQTSLLGFKQLSDSLNWYIPPVHGILENDNERHW